MEQKSRSNQRPKFNKKIMRRRRIILAGFLSMLVVLLIGIWFFDFHQFSEERALAPYPIRGCVINQENGTIDFPSLEKQKVTFAYLNATTGVTYFDDKFNSNYNRIQATNIKVGIIHNFSFEKSAKAQFEFIKKQIKSNIGQLPITIQVSYYNDDQKVNWKKSGPQLAALVKLLANHYSQAVVIKTTPAIQKQINHQYIKNSHFWIEDDHIKKRTSRIDYVEYDSDYSFKNGSDKITLPASYFNGDQEAWNELTY